MADEIVDRKKTPWFGLSGYAREQAMAGFPHVSQDVPLCPTSAENPLPSLPEEAGDGLTPPQRLAIAAMIAGGTFTMAAKAAGVDRRTIYRWRKEPAFLHAVDGLTRDALETTATRIRNLMLRATRVMSEAMSGYSDAGVAIRIANSARLWASLHAAEKRLNERDADISS